jgi:hypothetical protein
MGQWHINQSEIFHHLLHSLFSVIIFKVEAFTKNSLYSLILPYRLDLFLDYPLTLYYCLVASFISNFSRYGIEHIQRDILTSEKFNLKFSL